MHRRLFLTVLLLLTWSASAVWAIDTKAKAAMVLDFRTGTVLLEKNADKALPPASMSKLMTLNMVFEALEDGRLSLEDKLPVSKHAMSYGGSTMFLNTRDKVRVEDLIRGVIVLSGNDACVVLAEALAGSEPEFAKAMTKRAQQLGMNNSSFGNSNGWPHPMQRMSTRDLVTLATRLIREFPQYYGYFAEKEFAFDNRSPANKSNRNPLLKLGIGADGLKTGHTREAGFGLVGSAEKNGRRIVLMITGLNSEAERAAEAAKLTNWAFGQFVEKKILREGEKVGTARIWLGDEPEVALEVSSDVTLLLPVAYADRLEAVLTLNEPIEAPIEKGAQLGSIQINIPDLAPVSVPVFAAQTIEKSGFFSRIRLSASTLIGGMLGLAN